MRRLVIALTTLLTLVGAVVVGGYLAFFSASPDRAAAAVPAEAPIYVSVYLEPSGGQQMNLGSLIGRLPGFGDQAALGTKVDEAVQQLLSGSGFDYRRDLKPWLGDQLAVAVTPAVGNPLGSQVLLIAAVKDAAAARAALARLSSAAGGQPSRQMHAGVTMEVGSAYAYAFLGDGSQVVIGRDAGQVSAAIDASSGARRSLADQAAFGRAMASLPTDRLASAYLDLGRLAAAEGMTGQLGGFSTVSLALVAQPEGLEVTGGAPFDPQRASPSQSGPSALSAGQSSLSGWMPATTSAEAAVFGLRDLLTSAETRIGQQPGAAGLAQTITQLRAIVAFGLGLNVDTDLLPLLDRETGLAFSGVGPGGPRGQLLLRPSDSAAAQGTLDRLRDALSSRGATVTTRDASGVPITTVAAPQLGSVSYALSDGVVILALTPDDVAAALAAHADGQTLVASSGYRRTFEAIGGRAGAELYVDLPRVLSASGLQIDLSTETRDMLTHISGVALTLPARADRIEVHLIATIR